MVRQIEPMSMSTGDTEQHQHQGADPPPAPFRLPESLRGARPALAFFHLCTWPLPTGSQYRRSKATLIGMAAFCCAALLMSAHMLHAAVQSYGGSRTLDRGVMHPAVILHIALVLWRAQALVSVVFLAVWKWNDSPRGLLRLISEATGAKACGARKCGLYSTFGSQLCAMLVICTVAVATFALSDVGCSANTPMGGDKPPSCVGSATAGLAALSVLVAVAWFGSHATFAALSLCVHAELKALNAKWTAEKGKLYKADVLRAMVSEHGVMCEIVQRLENMASWYLFWMLMTNAPFLVMTLYYGIRHGPDSSLFTMINIYVYAFINFEQIKLLTVKTSRINEQLQVAKELLGRSQELWQSGGGADPSVRQEAHWFCARTELCAPRITAAGFVTIISRSFVFSMVSLIVTYTVILLQFPKPSGDAHAAVLETDIIPATNHTTI